MWADDHRRGAEEGIKNRPCALVAATRRDGDRIVAIVVPVTHSPPADPETAIEIPAVTKARLGLDPGFSPSFIVVNAKHNEVWDRCWVKDQPGACFEILYQHRLAPGRSYHTGAKWDQGSGTSSKSPTR